MFSSDPAAGAAITAAGAAITAAADERLLHSAISFLVNSVNSAIFAFGLVSVFNLDNFVFFGFVLGLFAVDQNTVAITA